MNPSIVVGVESAVGIARCIMPKTVHYRSRSQSSQQSIDQCSTSIDIDTVNNKVSQMMRNKCMYVSLPSQAIPVSGVYSGFSAILAAVCLADKILGLEQKKVGHPCSRMLFREYIETTSY